MLFWPLKTNVSLLKFSGLITSNYRSVYISMSTGRISPVLCSFTHSSLSLAGSTFRSNWSTSSTVWKEEKQESKCQGHTSSREALLWHAEQLWACLHCTCRQGRAAHTWEWMDKTGLNVQPWGKHRRGLTWGSRDRFPVPGSSQAAWILSCHLHLTPNTTVLSQHAFKYLINGQFLIRKIHIYTPFPTVKQFSTFLAQTEDLKE